GRHPFGPCLPPAVGGRNLERGLVGQETHGGPAHHHPHGVHQRHPSFARGGRLRLQRRRRHGDLREPSAGTPLPRHPHRDPATTGPAVAFRDRRRLDAGRRCRPHLRLIITGDRPCRLASCNITPSSPPTWSAPRTSIATCWASRTAIA